jgi:4-carboxymuconolactone decarboxylase
MCGRLRTRTVSQNERRREDIVTESYRDRLKQLAVSDALLTDIPIASAAAGHADAKTLALARLAALIAIGAPDPSFGEQTDAAVSAGADADEIVDVLVGVAPVVGTPRVVAAAPQIALALGYDIDDDVL